MKFWKVTVRLTTGGDWDASDPFKQRNQASEG
jgi:hypothetical protein